MIDLVSFQGFDFYVLRDDLLGEINGNKARKMQYLLNLKNINFSHIVSYGSSQSNAMLALSIFCKRNNLKFTYFCPHLNYDLKILGNLKFALDNKMKLFIHNNAEFYAKKFAKEQGAFFIKRGLAEPWAKFGFADQSRIINKFAAANNLKFDIFLPSGTGTSAVFLANSTNFNVFTCSCVGDELYLKKQIEYLSPIPKNLKILKTPKKYQFAKPNLELLDIWKKITKSTNIIFDLIYDPVGFLCVFSNLFEFKNPLLYIHQGGLISNESQIARY